MNAKVTGLILTGGGARAAYQAGVLKAIARIRRSCHAPAGNPFQVLAGTSAGAINAAALAARADHFDQSVAGLVYVWRHFHAGQVYRADPIGVIRTGARWLTMLSFGWMLARWRRARPRSLLDNQPLRELLNELIPTGRIKHNLDQGHLRALAITASSYGSGQHVTFFDTRQSVQPWVRTQRLAVPQAIGVEHLLASSAIPFIFPATRLAIEDHTEYFGDGSMRQSAPISPVIHLGAERIMVIGAGRIHEPPAPAGGRAGANEYPSLAQVAGHALSNIFLDALAVDVERLQRINHTLSMLPPEIQTKTDLRPIELLVIAPSQRLDDIAGQYLASLPATVRALLGAVGVSGKGHDARGAALASYLLFEESYTRELVKLGESDTLGRSEEVITFFGWSRRKKRSEIAYEVGLGDSVLQ